MPSLRDFIAALPPDEVMHVTEPVALDYEPTALVLELEKAKRSPVVYLDQPTGAGMPIVTNLFGDRGRIARIAGATAADFNVAWGRVLAGLKPPRVVPDGPVHEQVVTGSDVDVGALPICRHFAQDAGPYINAGVLVCKDPDTGVRNLSFQRLLPKGKARLTTNLGSRGDIWEHLGRMSARGKNLEVAVVIGAHPAIYLAAAAKVAMTVDEYDIAGSLLGAPLDLVKCKTIDVEVPAEAEIVLEGELLGNEFDDEGPVAEYTGYASGRSTRNVFVVKAITRRAKPIYLDIVSGASSEHVLMAGIARQARTFVRLKEMMPNIKAVHYPKSGTLYHAYLSLKKMADGEARRALMLLFGLDPYVKMAVAFDDDVDVFDEDDVQWALATRFQADTGLFVVPKVFCNRIDPSSVDGMSAKMGLDATVPAGWDAERATVPDTAAAVARRLIGRAK
jgi:2,5-furandicarboxylate decarboxylase 1